MKKISKYLKFLDRHIKILILIINALILAYVMLPPFIDEFKRPFTYNESNLVNPESLEYTPLENGSSFTTTINARTDHFGAVYLYFKPVEYADCKQWRADQQRLGELRSYISHDAVDVELAEFDDQILLGEEEGDIDGIIAELDQPQPLICQQDNRFTILLTVTDDSTNEVITDTQMEIFHEEPEAFEFPFGVESQTESTGKTYRVEVRPVADDTHDPSFMGIALENNQLVSSGYYHLPSSQAREYTPDAVSILFSKILQFVTQYLLVMIIFTINIYFLYRSFPNIFNKLIIFNSLFFFISLVSSEFLVGTLSLMLHNVSYYLIIFVLSNLVLWMVRSLYKQEKEPIKLLFIVLFTFVLVVESLILFEVGTLNILERISTISQILLGIVVVYYAFSLKKKDVEKNFEKDEKILTDRLVKWLLSIIVLLAFVLRFYNLGVQDFREDEFQVIAAAKGYMETGEYYSWDWIKDEPRVDEVGNLRTYTRAWPHTFLIAQTYNLLGVSEFSSRLISVFFGVLLIAITYPITKFFTHSKLSAILTTAVFTFYTSYIGLSRYTRMYALLIPMFLLLIYYSYRFTTEKNTIDFKNKIINNYVNKYLNLNWKLLPIFLVLLYFNYHIHINSMVIIPILFLFIIYMSVVSKELKYRALLVIGTVGIVLTIIASQFTKIPGMLFLSFFEIRNYEYLSILSNYPLPVMTSVLFAIVPFLVLKKFKDNELKNRLIFLYIIIFFSLVFFIFVADRYIGFLYVSHISAVSIILIVTGFVYLIQNYSSRYILYLSFLFVTFTFPSLITSAKSIYTTDNVYGNYSEAYQVIINNFDPDNDVIFGQFPRDYYLQDLPVDVRIVSLERNQNYTLSQLKDDLNNYDTGWITWETRKGGHLREEVIKFIDENFVKIHGKTTDGTNIEVYKF